MCAHTSVATTEKRLGTGTREKIHIHILHSLFLKETQQGTEFVATSCFPRKFRVPPLHPGRYDEIVLAFTT